MPSVPDTRLVNERAVLPVYQQQDLAGTTVLLPPPPSTYGQALLFEGNPEVYERSRQALQQYRSEYQERDDFPYPFRLSRARHTGLPAFLNGYVKEEDVPDIVKVPRTVATNWLFEPLRAEVLFGADADKIRPRFQFVEVVRIGKSQESESSNVHVRYQQMHQEWPLHGGGAVVHLTTEDPRGSVTCSYFPISDDLSFEAQIDEAQAIELAQRALAGYLEGPEAIGLYWRMLQPWLATRVPDEKYEAFWGPVQTRIAEKQIRALAEFSERENHLYPEMEKWVQSGRMPATQAELLALLYPVWKPWHAYESLAWKVEVVPYAGSRLFVFPFAGEYYLTYQIEFHSPNGDQAWRVFVDSQSGAVLGRPENRVVQALPYYPNSGAGSTTDLPIGTAVDLSIGIGRFMKLKFHADSPGGERPVELATYLFSVGSDFAGELNIRQVSNGLRRQFQEHGRALSSTAVAEVIQAGNKWKIVDADRTYWILSENQTLNVYLATIETRTAPNLRETEAVNVAYHANRLYEHFRFDCHAPTEKLGPYPKEGGGFEEPRLEVAVGRGGTDLFMGFNPASPEFPKLITFQTDSGSGLNVAGAPKVCQPSLDPELVYHEIAHGLMYLLNNEPFDQQNSTVPFSRPLLEGYATYFARSLADAGGDGSTSNPQQLWARAAYRALSGGCIAGIPWGNRWSLSRSDHKDGEDYLAAPNLYPSNETEGLPVYDAGMVWARALWDIRTLLGPILINQTDQLALNAFLYLHGWTTNFEVAAEGFIDGTKNKVPAWVRSSIINLFAQRGILAERGIQALASDGVNLFVGTDAGLNTATSANVSKDPTISTNWSTVTLGGSGAEQDVVALASEGNLVYAATEDAVYNLQNATSPVGYLFSVGSEFASELNIEQVSESLGRQFQGHGIILSPTAAAKVIQAGNKWTIVDADQRYLILSENTTLNVYSLWPADRRPMCMLVVAGIPYVGSGRGVWQYDNGWKPWGVERHRQLDGLALQMADALVGVVRIRYAAMLAGVMARKDTDPPLTWENPGQISNASGNPAIVTAIAEGSNIVYAGTLKDGIWHQTASNSIGTSPWTLLVSPSNIGDSAVLCLVVDYRPRPRPDVDVNQLWIGTTSGLYKIDLNSRSLSQLAGLPANAMVTRILIAGNLRLIGTAANGLYLLDASEVFHPVAGIGP